MTINQRLQVIVIIIRIMLSLHSIGGKLGIIVIPCLFPSTEPV